MASTKMFLFLRALLLLMSAADVAAARNQCSCGIPKEPTTTTETVPIVPDCSDYSLELCLDEGCSIAYQYSLQQVNRETANTKCVSDLGGSLANITLDGTMLARITESNLFYPGGASVWVTGKTEVTANANVTSADIKGAGTQCVALAFDSFLVSGLLDVSFVSAECSSTLAYFCQTTDRQCVN